MKIIIILLSVLSISIAQFNIDKFIPCLKEANVSYETVYKFIWDFEFDENDENLKCYFKCVLNKGGVINERGKLVHENIVHTVVKTNAGDPYQDLQLMETIRTCGKKITKKDDNTCQKAFDVFKCLGSENGTRSPKRPKHESSTK